MVEYLDDDDVELEAPAGGEPNSWEFPRLRAPAATIEDRKYEFCRLLEAGCTMGDAADGVGTPRRSVYKWMEKDPTFRAQVAEARKVQLTTLVAEAERRALKHSDKLLMFLLASYDPARFRQTTRTEVTGANGGPVQTEDLGDNAKRAERVAALLDSARARKDDEDCDLA